MSTFLKIVTDIESICELHLCSGWMDAGRFVTMNV